jgi:hypothetical protein
MSEQVTRHQDSTLVSAVVRQMHNLVTYGPWDLDVASAMSVHGYDQVKWAEGQGMLAELVSNDDLAATTVAAAWEWYDEAAATARCALSAQPQLLTKLGLAGMSRS